ncbi:hypothetical protein [Candidatus Protofrankia californiensis]|uniref:hypothetical protein n=1 Tax=Candidatus Protofrankia californiensis TaxID=1839754 RepID=UPI001F49EDD4|nr:hypothetical protein [Candidatus Protofrankia californiensis]
MDPEYGWLGSDGCYYRPARDFTPTPVVQAAEATLGVAGSWYDQSCLGIGGTGGGVVWRPDADMAAVVPPSPPMLAQRAANRLRLPEPRIGVSPSADVVQTAGVPVWLWLEPALWVPVTATAAVPAVAVTATARPESVAWDFGSGGRVVCQGPGTVFRAGLDDPAKPSSDCGITFTRSSAGEPDGRFRATVTVSWSVAWAGAGQAGVFPGLTSQLVTEIAVGEAQALVVPVGRG